MAKKKEPIPIDNNIIDVSIDEAMPENYLPYAVEVSKDRALPDVRDGLKPVHRRILYGAYMLKAVIVIHLSMVKVTLVQWTAMVPLPCVILKLDYLVLP